MLSTNHFVLTFLKIQSKHSPICNLDKNVFLSIAKYRSYYLRQLSMLAAKLGGPKLPKTGGGVMAAGIFSLPSPLIPFWLDVIWHPIRYMTRSSGTLEIFAVESVLTTYIYSRYRLRQALVVCFCLCGTHVTIEFWVAKNKHALATYLTTTGWWWWWHRRDERSRIRKQLIKYRGKRRT